jgi:hypothetical protein
VNPTNLPRRREGREETKGEKPSPEKFGEPIEILTHAEYNSNRWKDRL